MGKEDLNAEERLAKLKKLKEEKEKEIVEAKKLIFDTEEEISSKKIFEEKVPIPQVAAENVKNLSESEKLVVMTQRQISKNESDDEDDEDKKNDKNKSIKSGLEEKTKSFGLKDSLEETVSSEQINPELMQKINPTSYGASVEDLSQIPITQLYDEVKGIYETGVEKGYFSEQENRNIRYINQAIDQKMNDVEQGSYTLTEEVAKTAILSKEIAEKVNVLYKSGATIYDPNRKDN
ncbi:hypothetical protein HN385_01995 [archaeon]|jgi:hypothetical protein|nr:hypothetical protein [archaeon]MBT6869460.1 hypothetical protein [archaeon]MBT7192623.1 hypothetical protein [archaeon]MBT7380699.1 hypothetical protein [archaeon]MBT7507938.1 hypothetical protein [archaeon]